MVRHAGAHSTHGGNIGHWLRRMVHVCMLFVPIAYYPLQNWFNQQVHFSLHWVILLGLMVILLFEFRRITQGIVVLGQRDYEAKRLSSFAWGALSISMVLLLVPEPGFAVAIVASAALADPVVGECRLRRLPIWFTCLVGIVIIGTIWLISSHYYQFPWQWALIISPLMVALEWPSFTWIDDNALMQLGPLLMVLLLY